MPYKLLDIQKSAAVATQTTISVDGEGKWIGIDQEKEEIDPFVFSDDDISDDDGFDDAIESDSDDDGFDDAIMEDDIKYTDGEIRAIAKQKAIPDDEGFMECNPHLVEICAMDIKERRYRLKRGLTADSGAGDSVIPKRMVNSKKIRSSPGSRRGLHYVSATDHRIPNVGEISLEFQTDEGQTETIVFQVADVNKPLMSISDRVDHRCRVVFDQDDETGEDLSHIYNKKTKKKKMKLNRVGKVWVLDCTVTSEFISELSSAFSRPGL